MHPLIDKHPELEAIEDAKAKAEASAAAAEKEIAAEWDDYRVGCAAAAREGAPLPTAPASNPAQVRADLAERLRILGRERDRVIAEHGGELLEMLRQREADLLAEVAPLAARLDEITAEVGHLIQAAVQVAPGPDGSNRYVGRTPESMGFYGQYNTEVGVVLVAAQRGWKFISEPIAPVPGGRG